MAGLPDDCVDFLFTDLPYGTTNCRWDTPIDLNRFWHEAKRVVRKGGCKALFAQTPFDKILGCSNLNELRYEWIWEKTQATGHLNAKKMPMKAHENILIFYDHLPTYNPQITHGHERKVSTAAHKRNCRTGEVYHGYGKRDMTVQTVTPVMFCEGRATNKNHVYMQRKSLFGCANR